MLARTIMVQGTASSVGKSVLVAALCRILRQDGHRVAPFKSQNMSLNSFVTAEGGEIGRAQAVQAEAAGAEPTVHMNPILLKPESDSRSQVIVRGIVWKTLSAREYWNDTLKLLGIVEESLARLRERFDIIVIEGAGSPAEINLREHEIVNMRVARMSGSPVLLVGDVDRGGVFAALLGTVALLTREEREYVKGLIINRFRGDIELLRPGVKTLVERVGKPCLGVVPYISELGVAQEDSVYLDTRPGMRQSDTALDVAVIWLPHMSNYDDFDPLEHHGCGVRYVSSVSGLGSPHLIILPGTKTTMADLGWLRRAGLDRAILDRCSEGTPVIGVCGGYQILGRALHDPEHVESNEGEVPGLGLLEVDTIFGAEKRTVQVEAVVQGAEGLLSGMGGVVVRGYEIHMGRTIGSEARPALRLVRPREGNADQFDGSLSRSGRVLGTYIHGLFNNEDFTRRLLATLSGGKRIPRRETSLWRQQEYNRLASIVRQSLDMKSVYEMIWGG